MEFVPAAAAAAAAADPATYGAPPPYLPADLSAPPPHQPYHYYAAPIPNANSYPSSYAGTAYETSAPQGAAVTAAYSHYQSSYGADAYAPHGGYAYQLPAAAVTAAAASTSGYAVAAGNGAATASYHGAAEASGMVNYPPMNPRVGNKRAFEDLEAKKQKLIMGGAAADSVRVCVPCNVVFNSETVYAIHLAGEKHSMKTNPRVGNKRAFEDLEAKKQKLIMGGAAADSVRICLPCNVVCNSETVYAIHLAGEKHSMKVFGCSSKGANVVRAAIPSQATAVLNKSSQKKAKVVNPVSCNVCKLECDTEKVLAVHMMGKKHMKNMMRLESSVAKPAEKVLPVGDKQRNPAEDLEAKKQAMLNNGTPADEIKVCTVCNIPCNGQASFDSHVSGQRHMNLLNCLQQQVASVS